MAHGPLDAAAVAPVAASPSGEPLRVCVWPEDEADLVGAVRDFGAMISPPEQAEIIVSFNGSTDRMKSVLRPGIRFVQLGSVGVEKWIKAGLIDGRRTWAAAKGVYSKPMAEHALALMLCAACDLPRRIRASTWGPFEWGEPGGQRLVGKTVGIVGCGAVGEALIELLEPFGARILAVTRTGRAVSGSTEHMAAKALPRVLKESDYVVVAAPATPETSGLISKDAFRRMRATAWLINVSRGSLVDTDALVAALRSGSIAGCALDVVEPTPLPDDHPLWKEPNAIVTPHVACPRDLCLTLFAVRIRENLERYSRGQEPLGMIDSSNLY